jgi:hypothetical protein
VTRWRARFAIFGGEAIWIKGKSIGLIGKKPAKPSLKGELDSKT